jgi:endoglucanase
MSDSTAWLRTDGPRLVDGGGRTVRLRGVGLGGWLNMENFITGYAANEAMMRSLVRQELGADRYELFFERLLSVFFDEADVELLAGAGLNALRIPVNYHHFEDDMRPFEINEDGFAHLDRVIDACASRGIYSIIDLHAVPGSQNHHWHSDNATHVPLFWVHRQFQDRLVHLWEVIADRYKDQPWVAGYNPINEPADATKEMVGPVYERLMTAIRAIDPAHILFLDGNTYSTEFDMFDEPWDNTVYTCHDYVPAGLGYGGRYPGETRGVWVDRSSVERKFLERTEYSRRTGTPIWVGEFGPTYTGNPEVDAERSAILADQLDLYRDHDAGWSIWTYKDMGLQGIATVAPESAYARTFKGFMEKKHRLAADHWGSDGIGVREVTQPVQDLVAREFPDFSPYPWGAADWTRTLLLTVMMAQPLAVEYAKAFRHLDDHELLELADSFALHNCDIRRGLLEQLSNG